MIDVVIPAYNAASYLRATLDSIAAQTLLPSRVLVVDDRSTDDTVAVAEAAAAELAPRIAIEVMRNRGPQGPSGGRNTAIRASEAPFIALLDADDLFTPRHHAALLPLLQAVPDATLAFGDNTIFNEQRTLVPSLLAQSGVAALPAEEVAPGVLGLGPRLFPAMLRTSVFCTSACLFRREAALEAGLFDEEMMFSEDQDFFLRLLLRGRFVFTREVVTLKRVHGENLSQPRNTLRFCRGTAEAVARLAGGQDARGQLLDPAQREAVRAALPGVLGGYLYHASRAGFGAYWEAARLARRVGLGRLAQRPRHLLRTALSRFV